MKILGTRSECGNRVTAEAGYDGHPRLPRDSRKGCGLLGLRLRAVQWFDRLTWLCRMVLKFFPVRRS
jgi:hypothetical protein